MNPRLAELIRLLAEAAAEDRIKELEAKAATADEARRDPPPTEAPARRAARNAARKRRGRRSRHPS